MSVELVRRPRCVPVELVTRSMLSFPDGLLADASRHRGNDGRGQTRQHRLRVEYRSSLEHPLRVIFCGIHARLPVLQLTKQGSTLRQHCKAGRWAAIGHLAEEHDTVRSWTSRRIGWGYIHRALEVVRW